MKTVIISVLLVFVSTALYPQKYSCKECELMLDKVLKNQMVIAKSISDTKKNAYSADYEFQLWEKDGGDKLTESVRVVFSKSKCFIKTTRLTMVSDLKSTIVIYPDNRQIIMLDSDTSYNRKIISQVSAGMDSLFNWCTIKHCAEVPGLNLNPLLMVKLSFTQKGKKVFLANDAILYVNKETMEIVRMTVNYTEDYYCKSMDVKFLEVNHDYQGDELKVSPTSYIFTGQKKIKSQYSEYDLIDKRKRL